MTRTVKDRSALQEARELLQVAVDVLVPSDVNDDNEAWSKRATAWLATQDAAVDLKTSLLFDAYLALLEGDTNCGGGDDNIYHAPMLELRDALAQALAGAFSAVVRRELAPHLAEIRRENAKRAKQGDSGSCATHDYCDANELMVEAWRVVFAAEPEIDGAEMDVMNAAWDLAKARGFRDA